MRSADKIAPLEGLRALAVGLVIVNHAMNIPKPASDYFTWWTPGPAGVRLFFVLSGFLITGILLRARAANEQRGMILRAFYVRRALRILPLALVAVLVACVLNLRNVRSLWLWYAAYGINIKMAAAGNPDIRMAHFWSLAVEEQFYMFWPLLILWLPRRLLSGAMLTMIAIAVLVRLGLLLAGELQAAYVLMPARLDALAAGGVLAWSFEHGRRPPAWLWAGGAAVVAVGAALPPGAWSYSWMEGGMVIVSVMIVDALRNLRPSVAYRAIANPVLVYLGGISYGIYVWHGMVADVVRRIEFLIGRSLHLPYQNGWSRFVYITVVGIAAAVTSWCLFERPLNNLKRYFPYGRPRAIDAPHGSRVWSRPGAEPSATTSRPAEGV